MIQKLMGINPQKGRWVKIIGGFALLAALLLVAQMALANISPEYLKNGRTYDQESAYIFVSLEKLMDDFQAEVQRILQEVKP